MALVIFGIQCNDWLGHNTISSVGSLVVKGLTKFVSACVVGD